MDVDSRGRILLAESSSILILAGLPLVNSCSKNLTSSPLSRQSFCITSTIPTPFQVVGLQVCRLDERRVVAWGATEACVYSLNDRLTEVESTFALDSHAGSSDAASDYIVSCQFLPGSSVVLVVGSMRSLSVYDLARGAKGTIPVAKRIAIGPQRLEDFVAVQLRAQQPSDRLERGWRVYVLHEDGRLKDVALQLASDGQVLCSDAILATKECMQIPIPGQTSSLSTATFGSGASLSILRQSGLLVYQAPSSRALGISFGSDGRLEWSFELLPANLSLGLSGQPDARSVCGPYSQWVELGAVRHDKNTFFRLSCIGKRSRTKEGVSLYVEFNRSEVKCAELAAGKDAISSMEGAIACTAYSAPVVSHDSDCSNLEADRNLEEKLVLCNLCADGALHFLVEESASSCRGQLETNANRNASFPLLAFERMTNISETDLVLDAPGLGSSKEIARVLSTAVDSSLNGGRRDGDKKGEFTVFASLPPKPSTWPSDSRFSRRSSAHHHLVIAAVRVLVGSNGLNTIPKMIKVQGRPISLKPEVKRWYSIHLTPQEVALTARSGFLALNVSQTFDGSCNPSLDALEVFAVERSSVARWLQGSLRPVIPVFLTRKKSGEPSASCHDQAQALLLALKSLSGLTSVLGPIQLQQSDRTFLERLIEDSVQRQDPGISEALERALTSFAPTEDIGQSSHDKAVLTGCSSFISRCHQLADSSKKGILTHDRNDLWSTLRASLKRCLQAAARIAKLRPISYVQALDDRPKSRRSISLQGKNIVTECLNQSLAEDFLISDFVELSLLETAVGLNEQNRGGFQTLRELLESTNPHVAEEACFTVSQFCARYSTATSLEDSVCDIFAPQYGCDCCELFPLIDVRYSMQDEDNPVDLCVECYKSARKFAERESESADVVLNGKTIGTPTTLTCGRVKQLREVPIRKVDPEDPAGNTEVVQRQQLFDEFLDGLFVGVLGMIADAAAGKGLPLHPVVWLAVDLALHASRGTRKVNRIMRLVTELAKGLQSSGDGRDAVVIIDAMSGLIVQDIKAREYLAQPQNSVSDSAGADNLVPGNSITCPVHGVQASRRKFSDDGGVFYACGVERKSETCNYFAWVNQGSTGKSAVGESEFRQTIAESVWNIFTATDQGGMSLLSKLNVLVEKRAGHILTEAPHTRSGVTDLQLSRDVLEKSRTDYLDGVFCSRSRLDGERINENLLLLFERNTMDSGLRTDVAAETLLLKASLEFIALVARGENQEGSAWYPFLCKTILSPMTAEGEPLSHLRLTAKRALRQICGRRKRVYLAVRDHHIFQFHHENFLRAVEKVLKECLRLKKKLLQCGPSRKMSHALGLASLQNSMDLWCLDLRCLIPEDVTSLECNMSAGKVLDEILGIAHKRGENWRRFCGLEVATDPSDSLLSPISVLLGSAGTLNPANQSKCLKLINLALLPPNENRVSAKRTSGVSSDDEASKNDKIEGAHMEIPGVEQKTPEHILNMSSDDIVGFVQRFVIYGCTAEIRSLAASVTLRLCQQMGKQETGYIFFRLIGDPLANQVGGLGKAASEFLSLLVTLVKLLGAESIDVTAAASQIQSYWKCQMLSMRHDRSNGEYAHFETRSTLAVQKKRFELSECSYCHRPIPAKPKDRSSERSSSVRPSSSGRGDDALQLSASKMKWAPEQVSPFSRSRLEAGRERTTSNEFNTFFAFKCRFAISGISVDITDARGRYLKLANIYFTPRPVDDVSSLKAEGYMERWQRCGSLELSSRGATHATCNFSQPVVAANMRIEYAEFYDRPGSTKLGENSLVVHCPRCSRIVTNSAAVCSSCGEVAFQCRKCRHINYDRLDAFLCVECGYCASGSFQFEIMAGVASNAFSITNDLDFKKTSQMLGIAVRLHHFIKKQLLEKLTWLMRRKKALNEDDDNNFPSRGLTRAYDGDLPVLSDDKDDENFTLSQLTKQGSAVRMVACIEGNPENPLALFSRPAARITADPGSWRGSEGLVIRHLARDDEESASDLFGGLLESTGGLARVAGLDPSDPLNRLIASVQSRRERRDGGGRELSNDGVGVGASQQGSPRKSAVKHAKEAVEECDRLNMLLRECEREAYELQRRVQAWSRLEGGTCTDEGTSHPPAYQPSHCSSCANVVANLLLQLWLRLFLLRPQSVLISQELVALLLKDDSSLVYKNLQDTKRNAVKEIALHSDQGSPIVLGVLAQRLRASHDTSSADILGQILECGEKGNSMSQGFVALAIEVMEKNEGLG